jgi:dipeptidyl aminopeptidase/acylaminoacyl peptidase
MRKILFIIFLSQTVFAQNEKILVSDLTKIKNIGNIVFSNDGTKAVFEVKSMEADEAKPLEYEYKTHLFLLDIKKPFNQVELTRGKNSASQPAFSSDNNTLAFVRTIKDKPQIFILPLNGGEPWQLTHSRFGTSQPQFTPDGKRLIFSTSISFSELLNDTLLNPNKELPLWSMEKPGFKSNDFLKSNNVKPNPDGSIEEIRAYLEKDVKDGKAKVLNRLNFQGEAQVEPEMKFTHWWMVELNENAKPILLTKGFQSFLGAQFINNGKSVLLTTSKDLDQHPDREQESKIIELELAGLNTKTIFEQSGKSIGNMVSQTGGNKIAMVLNTPNLLSFGQLCIANKDGSNLKILEFDRVPSNLVWDKNQEYLYFTAPSNGGFPLFRANANTLEIERLSDYESGIGSFAIPISGKILLSKNDIFNPSELYLFDVKIKKFELLTQLNKTWLSSKKISVPEKRTYTNSLGQKVDYWIMKPTFVENGKKYPLLLQLHGGPTAMWGPGEPSMWHEFQYFCAQGYGVVYPNQRGSGGYGKDFQFSNYRDWGTGPQEDALAACADAAKESWVDTSRQVITGGSYAGYLTAWIIAHDHRFKAAFAQRGVYDLTTFMGEGNAWRLTPNYFGLPWEAEETTKIRANSPYTFVNKIKTPLLIKHGENDLRTGVIQSEMMFKSLKYLEKEVEYVRMPGGTHELSRAGNVRQRIDRILRIYEFFERYVGI